MVDKEKVTANELTILWRDQASLTDNITEIERDWLFNEESLTKRLTKLSHNKFAVKVLTEGWQVLREDEYKKLAITNHQLGWVREVLLLGQDETWVYARSATMQTDLSNHQYDLTNIGNKSLGSILFLDKSFQRSPLEVTRYPVKLLPIAWQYADLWGRRSNFTNKDLNIIVQEIFLPPFWQQLNNKK